MHSDNYDIVKIVINDGEIFDGTVDQFKDCFFDNATYEVILDWCVENDFKVEITSESKKSKKLIDLIEKMDHTNLNGGFPLGKMVMIAGGHKSQHDKVRN